MTSSPRSTNNFCRCFGGCEGPGTAAGFAACASAGTVLAGARPGNGSGGVEGRSTGDSGGLNSGGSGRLVSAGKFPAAVDFNLNLIPVSAFWSPAGRTGGGDPTGTSASGDLANGVRSISIFSPDNPAAPTPRSFASEPTGGNPESEMASPVSSGSAAGLIVIRGLSLTEGALT